MSLLIGAEFEGTASKTDELKQGYKKFINQNLEWKIGYH